MPATLLVTGETVAHVGADSTTAGVLSYQAALLLSTVAGMVGGCAVLLSGNRFWKSTIGQKHSHLIIGGVMILAGLSFLFPGLISARVLSLSGGLAGVGGMIGYHRMSERVSVPSGEHNVAPIVVLIVAVHRAIEGTVYAISGKIDTVLGVAAVASVVAHATIENVAVGILYSQREQKLRGALSLILIQLIFLISAVAILESSLLVSDTIQRLSKAAAGGVLLFIGLREINTVH